MNKPIILLFIFLFISTSLIGSSYQYELIVSKINRENYVVETFMTTTQQYVDRKYIIMRFPSFLAGAKFIKTANDDKSSKGEDFLTFTVNRSVSVFVAHWSTIKHVPEWLKRDFQKTDLIINSGEEDYILYKRDFPAGGISLGGNIESDEEDHAMYSVIVIEQTEIPKIIEYINDDYKSLLANFQNYNESTYALIPKFIYQNSNDSILMNLREKLHLDTIASQENEVNQIIELMRWVNKRIKHNGSNSIKNTETLEIINYYDKTGIGVNCRAVSIVLNDVYLAMGFKARIVSCLPHEDYDSENHVTNLVYSQTLNKWIFMDPSFSAYLTDKNGLLLDHSEIRRSLIKGDTLIILGGLIHNCEPYEGGQDYYLSKYMSKNLFRFSSPLVSKYGYEYSNSEQVFVNLNPLGYKDTQIDYNKKIKISENHYEYTIQDDKIFWEFPANNE